MNILRIGESEVPVFKRNIPLKQILRSKSILLLGPRQTGKSTLLKATFPNALLFDLLNNKTFRSIAENFETFSLTVERYLRQQKNLEGATSTVIIDEIQRLPELLNSIHLLIEEHKEARFVLTGSSARKLRRKGTNLLGGRAYLQKMHPICSAELSSWPDAGKSWQDLIAISALPAILTSADPELEFQGYCDLYLREEIEVEAKIKNLGEFSRFLTVAAGNNGQQIVFEKVGARAGISAKMAQAWFQILEDTLFGQLLPTFKETQKREPVSSPKFYFFDAGLARFLQNRKEVPIFEDGSDLECFILQEINCWCDYQVNRPAVSYWRTKSKAEVDFIISKGKRHIAIEVKTTRRLSEHDFSSLKLLAEEESLSIKRMLVSPWVLSHDRKDGIEVVSVDDFLELLWKGKLFDERTKYL